MLASSPHDLCPIERLYEKVLTDTFTIQAYETKAASNAGANAREHRAWLQKHSPDEVRVANNARTQLSRIASQPVPAGRKHQLTRAYHRLRDERVSKRPQTPYSIFFNERLASGDFQGVKMSDAAKEAGTEWKALSEAEKKVCASSLCFVL